MIDQAERV